MTRLPSQATIDPATLSLCIGLLLGLLSAPLLAAGPDERDTARRDNPVSPALRLERSQTERNQPAIPQPATANRSIDGSGNHSTLLTLGQAGQPLRRIAPADYGNGIDSLAGADRPSARAVSNALHAQTQSVANRHGLSDMFWQWGQFLDHDIDLTDGVDPPESAPIAVPIGDPEFDINGSGTATISLNRSRYAEDSGLSTDHPRQQVNELTTWIDASQVYGSNEVRARQLRKLDGSGELRESAGRLLPRSLDGVEGDTLEFFAGDVRAMEQVGLTAMHTLFMREHNWQARRLRQLNGRWSDERIYQAARSIVAAEMQQITYAEFLPLLLGPRAIPAYSGYRPTADATIANEFSTAAFRLGHTLLSPVLLRLDASGNEISAGHLSLADAFFAPQRLRDEGGIEPLLRGLTSQVCQEIDVMVIDEVRNFLFGVPGAGGFDLASLNIQRGRDHGLSSYMRTRSALKMPLVRSFRDINSDPAVVERLSAAYSSTAQIDLWSGALAEPARREAVVGETIYRILRQQFIALRDGDRFWWQNRSSSDLIEAMKSARLIDIIRRNTDIGTQIDDDPWHAGQNRS